MTTALLSPRFRRGVHQVFGGLCAALSLYNIGRALAPDRRIIHGVNAVLYGVLWLVIEPLQVETHVCEQIEEHGKETS